MSKPGSPAPPFPGPASIVEAFRFVLGTAPTAFGAWAVYLPLVGAALGGLWLATDAIAARFAGRVVASAAVLLVHVAVTRGRSLLALGTVLTTLLAGRARRGAILTGRPAASARVVSGAAALAEFALLCWLGRFRPIGLAFAPLLANCSMVVLAVGSRAARADGRRVKFAPAVQFREFGIASAATFGLIFLTTEFLGLLLILATAAFSVTARVASHRWLDGVNETVLLATSEATQLVVLAVLLAF